MSPCPLLHLHSTPQFHVSSSRVIPSLVCIDLLILPGDSVSNNISTKPSLPLSSPTLFQSFRYDLNNTLLRCYLFVWISPTHPPTQIRTWMCPRNLRFCFREKVSQNRVSNSSRNGATTKRRSTGLNLGRNMRIILVLQKRHIII